MGQRGPVPKRSDERIRRNTDEGQDQVEKVTAIGRVPQPELNLDNPCDLAVQWYESLADSAQAQYYEPSDWATAQLVAYTIDCYVKASKPSSQMFAALTSAMSNLLVTEGDRRRVRLEIEREQAEAQVFDVAKYFQQQNSGGSQ